MLRINPLCIGKNQMTNLKVDGQPLLMISCPKVVITMYSKKKRILVGQEKKYDQDLMYGRVGLFGMVVSSRDTN